MVEMHEFYRRLDGFCHEFPEGTESLSRKDKQTLLTWCDEIETKLKTGVGIYSVSEFAPENSTSTSPAGVGLRLPQDGVTGFSAGEILQ